MAGNTRFIWPNLLFLFFLSLLPIFTKWVGNNFGEVVSAVGYMFLFLLVNVRNQFRFSSLMANKDELNRNNDTRDSWFQLGVCFVLILGAIVLSFFSPSVASITMIGLPLVISFNNLLLEHANRRPTRKEKQRRI
ncbi:MAG: hypothetical protein AB2421_05080 [Thermotaleaceae bacterium]